MSKPKFWLLSENKSQFIHSTYDFDYKNFGISIIDQFNGRQPYLCNYDFIVKHKQINVGFLPTIILDSQISNCLYHYLNKPDRASAEYKATRQLLRFVVKSGYDYNPSFCILESVIMNGKKGAKPYATELADTILRLHTMDEKVFLQEDRVIPDRKKYKEYAKRYELNCIDSNFFNDIVDLWVNTMLDSISESQINLAKEILDYTYAALLKMVLIHKGSRQKVVKKMQILSDFLEREFNLVLGREHTIAAYYFSDRLPPRFVTLESDMSFDKVRQRLRSTTRDFLLLRMPETLLLTGNEQKTILGFVCSADKAVRTLGRLFTIEYVDSLPPEYSLPNGINFNIEKLEQELGKEVVEPLLSQQKQRVEARLAMPVTKPLSREQLKNLIVSLEEQVKALCKE